MVAHLSYCLALVIIIVIIMVLTMDTCIKLCMVTTLPLSMMAASVSWCTFLHVNSVCCELLLVMLPLSPWL